jgi:hypothetical protein
MCFPAAAGAAAGASAGTTLGLSAGTWGSIGTGLQVAGLVSGAFGAARQSRATEQAYNYQAAVNRNNAQVAEWQAQDALSRGAKSEQAQRLKVAQLKSAQRAGFAARGVALDEGSPLAILQDSDYMGELDALTIRDNAAKEAWGLRNQGANYSSDASMLSARANAESPTGAAFSTLLTGAGAVASSWYNRTGQSEDGAYRKRLQTAASQFGWD